MFSKVFGGLNKSFVAVSFSSLVWNRISLSWVPPRSNLVSFNYNLGEPGSNVIYKMQAGKHQGLAQRHSKREKSW